jgi:glycosyltransferase involved in cell wall biosynthesis
VKLSVILPVYNEKETIERLIEKIKLSEIEKEIVVIDDASTDGTREILEKISNIKLISHKTNKGKGSAIRTGIKYAQGKFVIIQDGDLEYEPKEYSKLLGAIKNENKEIVYGSRFKGGGKFLLKSKIANKVLSFFTSMLFFKRITDMETCYKCMKREILLNLKLEAKRFDFEPEVTAKLLRKGYKIIEIPISYSGRIVGKKIGVKDGVEAILTLIKWRVK